MTETPRPIDALKGKDLNQAFDSLIRDGVNLTAERTELINQLHQLVYFSRMIDDGELRTTDEERTKLHKHMGGLRKAIQAPTPVVAKRAGVTLWVQRLMDEIAKAQESL